MMLSASPGEPSDSALIAEARRGSVQAFEQLLLRHHSWLYGVIERMVRDAHRANDLCQETFFKAWKAIGDFQGETAFVSWLYRIARNAVISEARRASVRPKLISAAAEADSDWLANATASDSDPQGDFDRSDRAAFVRSAIEALEADHREVVVLRDLGGQSYEEIAAALELPIGTVRSRLHRARAELKKALSRLWDDDFGDSCP